MSPLNLYARVRVLYAQLHARPRVQRAPGLPCALCFREGANQDAKLGRSASRDREAISTWPRSASLPAVTVAVRLKAVLMILERRFIEPDFSAETRRGRRPVGALCQ